MGVGKFIDGGIRLVAATAAAIAATSAVAVTKKATPARVVGPTAAFDVEGAADHLRSNSLSSFAPALVESAKFGFTAPGQSSANARMASAERAFRFTPSGKIDSRRAFSIGITTRVVAPVADASRAAAVPVETAAATAVKPAAYNVDLAVGWRNFAVSGGYARSEGLGGPLTSLVPHREAVDVGVSYRGASWKTSVQVAAEQGSSLLLGPVASPGSAPLDRRYSLEVGGAYLLTPQLSVNGGVKYKTPLGASDPLPRDQSVYLGTALTF